MISDQIVNKKIEATVSTSDGYCFVLDAPYCHFVKHVNYGANGVGTIFC